MKVRYDADADIIHIAISEEEVKDMDELGEDIFAEYTSEFRFTRTRTVVKLFAHGVNLVSRSEARRLLNGLEKFSEIILDFNRVAGVGPGFVDEIFRVWARQHPEVELIPTNMNAPIEFMVQRVIAVDSAPTRDRPL